MANDVAGALSRLSGSLERGFSNIGRARISRADYGLRRAKQEFEVGEHKKYAPIREKQLLDVQRQTKLDEAPGSVYNYLPHLKNPTAVPHMVGFLSEKGGKNFGGTDPLDEIAKRFGPNAKIDKPSGQVTVDGAVVPDVVMRSKAGEIGLVAAARSDIIKQRKSELLVLEDMSEDTNLTGEQIAEITKRRDFIKAGLKNKEQAIQWRRESIERLHGAKGKSDDINKLLDTQINRQQGFVDKYDASLALAAKREHAITLKKTKPGKELKGDEAAYKEWIAQPENKGKLRLDFNKVLAISKKAPKDRYEAAIELAQKDMRAIDAASTEMVAREILQTIENLRKGGPAPGKITLPTEIKTTSQALKYLMDSHKMTDEQARKWILENG